MALYSKRISGQTPRMQPRPSPHSTRAMIGSPCSSFSSNSDGHSAGGLNQLAQFVQVLGAGVADHKITQAIVRPAPHFKGQGGSHALISTHYSKPLFLENKNRNLMLADAKNEFGTRRLAEVADPSADQRER